MDRSKKIALKGQKTCLSMNEMAPILLFTYKRLEALKKTVEALVQNNLALESNLFVFSDGPKSKNDVKQIQEVRSYLKTITGFKKVNIKESPTNKGLANSIITGVSEVMEFSDEVIVLEDDLLTTSNFLVFMNQALKKYKNAERVFSISGYSFDLKQGDDRPNENYFLNRGWSWGWATWKDRWATIDWQVKDYADFKNDKQKKNEFAKGGSDLNKMLRNQMEGSLDSWAIRWFYHQYKVKGLTLYPVYSKVHNVGFDDLATHTTGSNRRYLPLLDNNSGHEIIFPESIEIHPKKQKLFQRKMGVKARIRSKIETIFQAKSGIK